ncbi:hypothetical protein Thimo_0994 [Thioflavicoccus mobilis 8321]|uniref:Glycosyltransferase n=1 Tax=Thioflavicoccus mobilis 8321 TaxID=765912 RepID=L0GUZ6_9GAMM|nr:hypothetical protein Thimo_0994 [Thioflavicoccus mobilis 8321]
MNWLRGQSSDPSWVRSAEGALCNGLGDVRIDLVWATFTPIECWTIADRFARARGIPFVADIKDNWSDYVPSGLRRLVAGRSAFARSLTANSSAQWPFFPPDRRPREVIYSGYWRDRLDAAPPAGQNPMLTGVFFGRPDLSGYRQLVDAMKTWAEARQRPLRLRFFGARHEEVQGFVPADGASLLRLEARPFLPPERLMDECRRADFNFYVRHPRVAIHHKATELMAAGRPILVWGAETAETRALAERVGVAMYVCRAQDELNDCLDRFSEGYRSPTTDRIQLQWLTWENQATRLLAVFESALKETRIQ